MLKVSANSGKIHKMKATVNTDNTISIIILKAVKGQETNISITIVTRTIIAKVIAIFSTSESYLWTMFEKISSLKLSKNILNPAEPTLKISFTCNTSMVRIPVKTIASGSIHHQANE